MHILQLTCAAADKDLLIARLWELDTFGVHENELPGFRWELHAWFAEPFQTAEFEDFQPFWREEAERDWVAIARSRWEPLCVGKKFYLTPEWHAGTAPEGRLRLVSRPGMASGSGYQPSTQLVLEAMEDVVLPQDYVLDVGTGSGILAAAACLLGAAGVIACDIDPDAAAIARQNLRQDGFRVPVFAGSPRSLRSCCAGLVLANLNAAALSSSAAELARAARPRSRLIVSGFRILRETPVLSRLRAHGFRPMARRERETWVCLTLER